MGTNFYAKTKKCKSCGYYFEFHLGKSAVGWKFLLQANGYKYYKDWPSMKRWLKDKIITDEFGRRISLSKFTDWVESSQNLKEGELGNIINGYCFSNRDFT